MGMSIRNPVFQMEKRGEPKVDTCELTGSLEKWEASKHEGGEVRGGQCFTKTNKPVVDCTMKSQSRLRGVGEWDSGDEWP